MRDSIVCSYSRTIARWLANRFPGDVELHSAETGPDEIVSTLQVLLPAIEFQQLTQGHCSLRGRIKQVTGVVNKSKQLLWLLDLFDESDLSVQVKDELYDQLKVFLKWNFDTECIQASQFELLDTMKLSLAMHCREIDPVTYADPSTLKSYDIGNGFHIALVGMQKDKRLSLESYIGYMVFKNSVPIAYGGGWIWGKRCRIGISVYPAFRKGESAWVFKQVLGLFLKYFRVRYFIIRPNQFGKNNYDGLKSGAFWFYYKLGFRPSDNGLKKLAAAEWKKIRAVKSYRSSLKTLRLFTACPMEWSAGNKSLRFLSPEMVSQGVSNLVNKDYAACRGKAILSVRKKISNSLKPVSWPRSMIRKRQTLDNWCLVLNQIEDFSAWAKENKTKLVDLIRIKLEGNERDHIIGMQGLPVFWKSLNRHNF